MMTLGDNGMCEQIRKLRKRKVRTTEEIHWLVELIGKYTKIHEDAVIFEQPPTLEAEIQCHGSYMSIVATDEEYDDDFDMETNVFNFDEVIEECEDKNLL